jgi:hypothetical protein
MSLLRRIEKAMDHRLRAIFAGGADQPGAREAIELYREALEQIAARVTVGKRSERIFPFNSVTIELVAPNHERKAVLEALFDAGQLVEDIRATLKEDRVTPPAELTVVVHYPEQAEHDLRVFCERTDQPAAVVAGLKTARLTTPDLEFIIDQPLIHLGREREVVDSLGRVIRRNDLFFPETEFEASTTVSRTHAHMRFDPQSGDWRIFDDGSSLGTSLFRDGKRIEVPGHASRGVALRHGDEINLGQVRLNFELSPFEPTPK